LEGAGARKSQNKFFPLSVCHKADNGQAGLEAACGAIFRQGRQKSKDFVTFPPIFLSQYLLLNGCCGQGGWL
jgi:hypothetical protein